MPHKIRLGHIGTAHDHSTGFMSCVRSMPDLFEVIGIAEPDPVQYELNKANPIYAGLDWLTEEELFARGVDAVLIETYELDLIKTALRWARRGVHLHIDKPAGPDLAEFADLLQVASEKNLIVQLGYMYRYNKAVLKCLELVRSGALGRIYQVDAIMNTRHSQDKRQWLGDLPGGNMFYLGCHMVDLVYLIQGKPRKVHALNRSTGFDQLDVLDHGLALFEYEHGISTVRANSTEINGYGRRQLVVCGEYGTVEIKPLENPTEMTLALASETAGREYSDCKKKIKLPDQGGRYDDMMRSFAAFIHGEKENPYDYKYEYEVHELVLAACGLAKEEEND